MFRSWILAIGIAMVPVSSAGAQPSWTMRPVPPLAQIGLPLPHIGLPPPEDTQPAARRTVPDDTAVHDRRRSGGRWGRRNAIVPFVYVPPVVVLEVPVERSTTSPSVGAVKPSGADARQPATLRLDLEPVSELQLHVDGYYMSLVNSTDTVLLEAGAHHIELRADGFEPVTFAVRLSPRETTTYRGRLKAVAPPPAAAPAMTMFVIPGCYAGNVPPDAVDLPAGCDKSRVTTLPR